jgi:hypothetical protein
VSEPVDTSTSTASGQTPSCGGGTPIDVWFDWSPDADGAWLLTMCNSAAFDTRITVWDACAGIELGCNDDGPCSGFTSELAVGNLLDADNYLLQVGGWSTESGTGTLNISALAPPPANDACSAAIAIADGGGSHAFDTTTATSSGVLPSCGGDDPPRDIWLQWSPDADASWSFATSAATYSTRIAVYTACGGSILECDTGNPNSSMTVPGLLDANDYLIQVAGTTSGSGTGMLDIAVFVPPTCGNPTVLPAGMNSIMVDTGLSSTSGLHPGCGGGAAPVDEFFEWTPDIDGEWSFETCAAATFDTRIALYDNCTGDTVLACNDDSCGFSSRIQVPGLVAGTQYYLQVGGFGGETGSCTVDIARVLPPMNDGCGGATAVNLGSNFVENVNSTISGLEPSGLPPYVDNQTANTACENFGNGADMLHNDVYYSFTPGSGSAFIFSTCGMASYDTKLALYSGACDSPTPIACNDDGDSCANFSTELRAAGLSAGSTYLLQVGGFSDGDTGTATLNISEDLPPAAGTNTCMTSINSVGSGAVMSSTGSASVSSNDLTLIATGGPVDEPGIFYYGASSIAIPFGEGIRCIVGSAVRLFPFTYSDSAGTYTKVVNNTAPQIASSALPMTPGSTYIFQLWYRDPDCADCDGNAVATGFNLSDAYEIDFTP